jgi:hypothetical protein
MRTTSIKPSKSLRSALTCALLASALAFPSVRAATTIQDPGHVVGAGDAAWSYLILEAESYETKANPDPAVGFTRVDDTGAITSSQGKPVLGKFTTASNKGALFGQTAFGQHIDKVTYSVQFAKAGTY